MKCDLCGTEVVFNNYFSYPKVANSRLCKECFNAVSAEVTEEVLQVEEVNVDATANSSEQSTKDLCEERSSAVATQKTEETLQIKMVDDNLSVNSSENSTDLYEKCRCPSCDSICEEWQLVCSTCGISLPYLFEKKSSADNMNGSFEPASFFDVLGKIILTIIAIIVLVPLSLFVVCMVGSAFH